MRNKSMRNEEEKENGGRVDVSNRVPDENDGGDQTAKEILLRDGDGNEEWRSDARMHAWSLIEDASKVTWTWRDSAQRAGAA